MGGAATRACVLAHSTHANGGALPDALALPDAGAGGVRRRCVTMSCAEEETQRRGRGVETRVRHSGYRCMMDNV